VHGKRTYENGDTYEGAFAPSSTGGDDEDDTEYDEEVRQGYGVFVEKESGVRYEGHWMEDEKEGFGVEAEADGTRYEGKFQKGKRHGAGVLLLPNGVAMCACFNRGKCISASACPVSSIRASSASSSSIIVSSSESVSSSSTSTALVSTSSAPLLSGSVSELDWCRCWLAHFYLSSIYMCILPSRQDNLLIVPDSTKSRRCIALLDTQPG
jgi:hypothetical protein